MAVYIGLAGRVTSLKKLFNTTRDKKTKEGQMIEIFLDAPIELQVILLTGFFFILKGYFHRRTRRRMKTIKR